MAEDREQEVDKIRIVFSYETDGAETAQKTNSKLKKSSKDLQEAVTNVVYAINSQNETYKKQETTVKKIGDTTRKVVSTYDEFGNGVKQVITETDKLGNKFTYIVDGLNKQNKELNKDLQEAITNVVYATNSQNETYKKQETIIKKIGDTTKKVVSTYDEFGNEVKQVITETDKLGNKSTYIVDGLNKQNKELNKGTKSLDTWSNRLALAIGKVKLFYSSIKSTVNQLSQFVRESNNYVENLNLFRVAFGNLSDEAQKFAENYSNALGLDPSNVMRTMGMFQQLATGFGIANDKAYDMSQTLTQLSYDISSLYNISFEDAIQKVQSGFAGELEPLRRLGYALDEATLQQVAYNHGVTQSVRTMTQAQKAQLRLLAIYEQSNNAMGDMAKTIESPANQIRILQQQFTQLKRSIGDVLIPFLNKVIPYINGAISGLTTVFRYLSKVFGFEVTGARTGQENNVSEYFDNITNSATQASEAMEGALFSFDKFDVASQPKDTSAETGDITGGWLDIETPTYDAFSEQLDEINSKAEQIGEKIAGWFLDFDADGKVTGLSTEFESLLITLEAIIALKFAFEISSWTDGIKKFAKSLKDAETRTSALSGALGILGAAFTIIGITELIKNWDNMSDSIKGVGIAIVTLGAIFTTTMFLVKTGLISFKTAFISTGIGAIIVAIGLLIYEIITNWDWIKENILQPVREWFVKVGEWFTKVGQWFAKLGRSIANVFADVINWIANGFISMVNGIIDGINWVAGKIAKLFGKDDYQLLGRWEANVNWQPYPDAYETGGFPTKGQLFIANENGYGSEYIGNLGNRQVVANNQQIVSGISNGVMQANKPVVAILNMILNAVEAGNVIQIDGTTLAESMKKPLKDAYAREGVIL